MFIGEKYTRESLVPKFPGKFIQSPITLAQRGKNVGVTFDSEDNFDSYEGKVAQAI